MALIATVDGQSVYSDKHMTRINNTRVEFDDGSWCDIGTGRVHNAGRGYISIGGSDSSSDSAKISDGPHKATASSLELRTVEADVAVEVYEGREIEYTITGPSNKLKEIQSNVRGSALIIEGDGHHRSGGHVSVSSGGRGMSISTIGGGIVVGGGVSIFGSGGASIFGGGGASSDIKIVVKVPKGTPVTSDRVSGIVNVGDIEADFTASVQSSDVKAGRVKNTQLSIQGSGDITVKHVDGSAVTQVQGSGDIEIRDGQMASLAATIQGSGDITVRGTAQSASLIVMGSGDIRVDHVMQEPSRSKMGSGSIKVRRIG